MRDPADYAADDFAAMSDATRQSFVDANRRFDCRELGIAHHTDAELAALKQLNAGYSPSNAVYRALLAAPSRSLELAIERLGPLTIRRLYSAAREQRGYRHEHHAGFDTDRYRAARDPARSGPQGLSEQVSAAIARGVVSGAEDPTAGSDRSRLGQMFA
jgi:hypothetical protein